MSDVKQRPDAAPKEQHIPCSGNISRNGVPTGTAIGVCSSGCGNDNNSSMSGTEALSFKLQTKTAGKLAIGVLIMQDIFAVGFLTASTGKLPSIWAIWTSERISPGAPSSTRTLTVILLPPTGSMTPAPPGRNTSGPRSPTR